MFCDRINGSNVAHIPTFAEFIDQIFVFLYIGCRFLMALTVMVMTQQTGTPQPYSRSFIFTLKKKNHWITYIYSPMPHRT